MGSMDIIPSIRGVGNRTDPVNIYIVQAKKRTQDIDSDKGHGHRGPYYGDRLYALSFFW